VSKLRRRPVPGIGSWGGGVRMSSNAINYYYKKRVPKKMKRYQQLPLTSIWTKTEVKKKRKRVQPMQSQSIKQTR
jgi:hypothetical protein